jgi:MOSC domain-containing protein YiiM
MKVVSTNISESRIITIGDEEVKTGMYKVPVQDGVFLTKSGVNNDAVIDLKFHGGEDKAAYFFGQNNYPYFKELYPNANWEIGMFGENLTLDFVDESTLNIGDVYQVGEAIVQISQPRIPCSKLGFRMGSPSAVKAFAEAPFPGIYVRVLQDGKVKVGDEMILQESQNIKLTLTDLFTVLTNRSKHKHRFKELLDNPFVTENIKSKLRKQL